ncbi:MAG: extracellular solute-binding protein [Anaerolineales bacterium]
MVEIEFSVMENFSGTAERLRPLLQAFEMQYHVHVNLEAIPWDKGWTEISKYGIFGHGPDVSEIGTTWTGSMAAMQALRPFTPQEVRSLGGQEAFFENIWRTGFLPDDPNPWAIPWLGDALVFYYWKDAFKKAGIDDAKAAFSSHDALVETLKKLQESGHPYPLALTTTNQNRNLHEASMWIWNEGGDILSADRRRVLFQEEAALRGLRKYFSLVPFISPASLEIPLSTDLFNSGDAIVAVAGPYHGVWGRSEHPEWEDNLGIAPLPGVAYVGGSSFVIWKYSLRERESFELIRFLATQPTRIPGSPHEHMLPTRRDAVHMPSVEQDVFHQIYLQTLQSGRSFPTVRLWGSIEEKLNREINNIWVRQFANPSEDIDACLHERLDPLAYRLNIVLGG